MRRRAITTDRLIAGLGLIVLLLGGAVLWAATHGDPFRANEPDPAVRVLRQVREQMGRTGDVRYMEPGVGRVVCGYAGRRGQPAVAFISRPNRILLADDPLRQEFDAMMLTACPGFARRDPPVVTP